ncbi:hypothetical protein AU476_05225 [Cupriavidus sp. UYMSc13B]|nr:hypothetical protein AU476_05225 [Cupriavidus sp. UYMSc13B]
MSKKIMISAEHAAKLLPRGKKVHTFFKIFGWMGADVDRTKVLAAFELAKQVEVSHDAACFGHQLAVKLDGMRTYIDTNQKALRKLVPQAAAT